MTIASHGVPLVRGLVGEDLHLPVLHVVHTQPGVANTVQDLIVPALHRGLQVLERCSQLGQLSYLWLGEVRVIQ